VAGAEHQEAPGRLDTRKTERAVEKMARMGVEYCLVPQLTGGGDRELSSDPDGTRRPGKGGADLAKDLFLAQHN
jgi:hypothetical protein